MNIKGLSRKNKSKISYPVYRSAIKPVSHDPDLPVPQPLTEKEDTLSVDEGASTSTKSEEDLIESDPSFQHKSAPLLINQERLNDLVRFGTNNHFFFSNPESKPCSLLCK